ncbi:MAG: hypothetical protein LBR52_06725 [Prevotellaceae bacterium]|jgi:hypothetical protein|nr:hypothetical protein [Prevotellaceae bacterium]
MKKILFLASALFLGWASNAQEFADPENPILFEEGVGGQPISHLSAPAVDEDGNPIIQIEVLEETAAGITFKITWEYRAGGWAFDNVDLYAMGYREIQVEVNQPEVQAANQISLTVGYYVGEGMGDYNGNSLNEQNSPAGASSIISLPIKQSITRTPVGNTNGYAEETLTSAGISYIRVENGYGSTMATPDNPFYLTITSAKLIKDALAGPENVTTKIDFEDFSAGYEFGAGKPYFGMHNFGWPNNSNAMVVEDPAGINGKSLKLAPTEFGMHAMFENLIIPEGHTVNDIKKIAFDVYWESYATADGAVEEGGEILETPILLYIGKQGIPYGKEPTITFANADAMSFEGRHVGEDSEDLPVGVIGEWVTNSVNYIDFEDSDINTGLIDDAANVGVLGYEVVSSLNEFTFGIGFNTDNGVFYIDNILFLDENGYVVNVQKVEAAASANVYAIEGGLAIAGGESATIYGIDGRVVATTAASTIALPKGVYIVKVGSEVVKAIVK